MMNYYLKKYLLSVVMLIGSLSTLMAQSIEVRGRVVDNQSLPMIGVSVVEKGTTNGAVPNIDGYYYNDLLPVKKLNKKYYDDMKPIRRIILRM